MPKERSLMLNKIALEKGTSKEVTKDDMSMGNYIETDKGLRHYFINYKGSKVKNNKM